MTAKIRGVLAPVLTPFKEDLSVDFGRLVSICRRLIAQDCGLAVFGTNSEGNSLSVDEKIKALDRLVAEGIPPDRMMPGTGSCAAPDAIRLTRHAVSAGCAGALMLPPFYYKDVSNDGVFNYFAKVIEGVGDDRLRIYLYHIPQVAVIGFDHDLIERLIKSFPEQIAGIKDSTGNFNHTQKLLERFPGWGVFCGDELNLAKAIELGAFGCISGTCNVNAPAIVDLAENVDAPDVVDRQEKVNRLRRTIMAFPMIPATKATLARAIGDESWVAVRPPLSPLNMTQRNELYRRLEDVGYF